MNHDHSLQCSEFKRLDVAAFHKTVRTRSGYAVHWRRFGEASGIPIILLHGGHGSWGHWIRNCEVLSTEHTVWIADMPGYGRSDSLKQGGDLDVLVETLGESVELLVGESTPINLCGFSFGALVASMLATSLPVHRLVLTGGAGHGCARRPFEPLRNWRRETDIAARTAHLRFNLHAFMLYAAQQDELGLCVHEDACLHTRFRSKCSSISDRLTDLLRVSTAEKLLIWGDHDVTLADPQAFSIRLKQNGVKHHFRLIEKAGHWVQFEKAAEVNQLLLDWLV